ncbi:hypothetical protein [Micromonospora sp. NPDC049891]|uniref:hypothetical protein n=1 Tax=Micromonospora sp. NPDC049891 TaxID=3155655 RepID=UPI0033E6FE65
MPVHEQDGRPVPGVADAEFHLPHVDPLIGESVEHARHVPTPAPRQQALFTLTVLHVSIAFRYEDLGIVQVPLPWEERR